MRNRDQQLAKAESRNRPQGELDGGIHVGDMTTAIAKTK
jgi:hypothetical protein